MTVVELELFGVRVLRLRVAQPARPDPPESSTFARAVDLADDVADVVSSPFWRRRR